MDEQSSFSCDSYSNIYLLPDERQTNFIIKTDLMSKLTQRLLTFCHKAYRRHCVCRERRISIEYLQCNKRVHIAFIGCYVHYQGDAIFGANLELSTTSVAQTNVLSVKMTFPF